MFHHNFFSRLPFVYYFSYVRHLIHVPILTNFNIQSLEQLSYAGIFLAIAFSGYIIPIPEELTLLTSGFLAAEHILFLPVVLFVAIAGAVCGDNIIYYLAGHGSRFTQKYHAYVEQTHAGWYLRHLRSVPFRTIFFSRFVIGMRALSPLVSGLLGVRWRIFISASFVSAAIYIPIIIAIGWFFHSQIFGLIVLAKSIREILLALFLVGSAVLISLFITNLLERKK